ncbi:MAG: hypothetical protein WBN77_07170, partial [Desulfobacterales bacterium]
ALRKDMPKRFVNVISAVIVSAWLGVWIFSISSMADNNTHICAENGPIESMQAYLLVTACVIYLATAVLGKRLERLIPLFCSLLCYSFVLREVDVETFNIPNALKFIGSGVGRNTTIAIAFLAIVYVALKNYLYYKRAVVSFIKSRSGVLLMAGGAFLFIGSFFEKNESIIYHVLFEEMAEISGYFFILLSSIASNSFEKSITIRSSGRDKSRR